MRPAAAIDPPGGPLGRLAAEHEPAPSRRPGRCARSAAVVARAAEWVGIAAGLALWVAILGTHAAPARPSHDRRAASHPIQTTSIADDGATSAPVSVSGRVVDAAGQPVAGAIVFASPARMTATERDRVATFAARDGRFQFSGLTPGTYSFVAIAGHHPPGVKEYVPVYSTELPLDLEIVLCLDRIDA